MAVPSQAAREAVSGRKGIALRAGAAGAVLLLALAYARHALATTFKMYDDEGYVLLSLDHYLRGGHLYTEVFSQYGPFYFFAQGAIFRLLHLPVSHDAGRLVTLLFWLASAGLGAYFVRRISGDTLLASAAGLAFVVLVRELCFEPGHPQQAILLILALACCLATLPGSLPLWLLGTLGAALLFTKINVGIFYLAALGVALACRFPAGRLRPAALGLALVYALGFPAMVMRQHLPGAATGLCLLIAVSGAATFLVAWLTTPPGSGQPRESLRVAAGALLAGGVICAEAVREGMSPASLLEGVLWGPLRHPGVYAVVLEVPGIRGILAVLVAGCVLGLQRFRARRAERGEWIEAAQCAIGFCAIPLLALSADNATWILPFLPLGLLRTRELPSGEVFPRVLVTCLAATQFLQAYPVAGTQIAIAASPLLLWAFVLVHDGAGGLARLLGRAAAAEKGREGAGSFAGGALAIGFAAAMIGSGACSLSYPTPPSGLAGARSLHLPAEREAGYRLLAGDIRANCDLLFTLPGMGSFNFWSGVPAPNGWNLTAWVKGFSPARQQRILEILRAHPRACAVYSEEMAAGWRDTPADLAHSALASYVLREMPKVAGSLGYEIRVHPRRDLRWVEVGAGAETDAPAGTGR